MAGSIVKIHIYTHTHTCWGRWGNPIHEDVSQMPCVLGPVASLYRMWTHGVDGRIIFYKAHSSLGSVVTTHTPGNPIRVGDNEGHMSSCP